MASVISHMAIPAAIAWAAGRKRLPLGVAAWGAVLSMAPDLDSIGYRFGVPYDSPWGHRGFTHSIAMAAVVACLSAFPRWRGFTRAKAFLFFFVSMVSHALCDALTNGGLGVALLWPFLETRYFFAWRVIEVSPIGVARFLGRRGLEVLESELVWIWVPSFALAVAARALGRWGTRESGKAETRSA